MFDLTLKTELLTLRPYRLSDAPRLQALANDAAIARMVTRMPYPYPDGEAERWIGTHAALYERELGYVFAIETDGALAGSVSVIAHDHKEFALGYWLAGIHWGKGLATEAARGVLAFAFDQLAIPYVRSAYLADNSASGRVLGKVGFLATNRKRLFHVVRDAEVELVEVVLPRNAFLRDGGTGEKVYKAA